VNKYDLGFSDFHQGETTITERYLDPVPGILMLLMMSGLQILIGVGIGWVIWGSV
jgi:hypothetical protein